MYCTKCGAYSEDSASFCRACGNPLKKAAAPGSGQTPPPSAGPPKSRSPLVAVLIVLAVLACIGVGIGLYLSQSGDDGGEVIDDTSSGTFELDSQSSGSADDGPSAEDAAMESVDGWWQSVGQSMSVFHHFVDGVEYIYQRDFGDHSVFTYSGSRSYTVEPFDSGTLDFTEDSGVAVHVKDGNTYILENASPTYLTCRNMDGSGYSGSGSLTRPDSTEITDSLLDLAAQVEGSGSTTTASPNPQSIDVSGEGYGEEATLTGVIERENMTPAQTGMIWGTAVYYLVFDEPVIITHNGPGTEPETRSYDRIQVWTSEANPGVSEEEAYLAEHPEEIQTKYDNYVGQTVTVRGHIINAGTAHYHTGGAFFNATVLG